MDGEKSSETPKDVEVDFLANAGEAGVKSGGLTPKRNDDDCDGKEKEEPDNETPMPSKSFFDDFLSSRLSHGNNDEESKEEEEGEEDGTGLRRRSPSSLENLDNPASRELYELKKQLESLKGELEQERRSKSSLLRKKERKKRKSKKRLQKRRARRSSDSDEDYDPGPLDDSPDAWEMERLPIDDSVDASPIRYDAAHGFFTGASHPGVLSPLDTSVDLQNTDLQALARQRIMQQGGESEQSLIDQSGFMDQSSLMDQSSMMDQSAMMDNQETTSSSYDSSSSSDDSDSDSEVDMIGGGDQGQGEGTSEGDLYHDEEDALYNIPSSTSSSSDSDDVQDEEFIFVPNSKKFEKRKKKKKKKKKERKRRQREMEEKYYQDEEAGPSGVGGGGGHGGPPRNSEDEYYVRDSKPFYDYTQTVYGSFQKDLAANAKKFAEEIHRKKKHKPPTHFFEGIVDRVWGLEENLKLKATHTFVWFYLIILGVFSALIGVAMDYAIIFIQQGHYYVTDQFTDDYWLRYMIWILYLLFFAGASMLSTRIAPTAQGSGIPEMKAILSGVNLRKYLTFNTLIAKILSITFSVGSGLVLGKVGPFIHTCATLANQLARLPLFHRIRENGYLLQQMLAVGCTMGVASNFGAPVGGVLFSIEVTSTYYPLNTYASAFKCAIVGALVFRYFWFDTSYIPTNFDLQSWAYAEIPWFVILGLFEGILGAFFIHFFAKVVERRRWFASLTNSVQSTATKQFLTFCNHPYVYGMMVALLTGIATYPGLAKFVSLPHIFALQDLFNDRALDDNDMNANDWSEGGTLLLNLFIFMIIRLLFLTISISMPLSSGVFLPLLVTGAAIGRFWGEFLEQNLPQVKYDINNIELFGWHIAPGGYALVGAAGLAGAATQTFSTAVIILEICGQLSFALPIVITVVIAVSTARMFSISIYDKISITRGLPWLPELPQSMYHMTVADVMKTNVQFLTYDATPQKIAKLLANPEKHKIYPIVNNASSMMVVGLVTRKDLLRYLLQSSTVRDWHTPVTMESNVSDSREVIPGLTEENRRVLPIKPATVQLFASTPLANCQMLFITLRLSDAFVTSNSKLVGIVTRNDLRMAIGQADFSPVWNFFRGIWSGFWGICFRR